MLIVALALALTLQLPSALVDDDVLEPSVQNEVDHALDVAPTNFPARADYPPDFRIFCATNDFFGTNGLSHTERAVRLVSAQKGDGTWKLGTNDVTAVAVEILRGL